MTAFPFCRLDELPDPGSRAFQLASPEGPVECFLVRRGERVFAYRNRCPHTGAPLDWQPGQFLDLTGELIQCALHGAMFLPETGECVRGPCLGAHLLRVPAKVDDGMVLVPSTLGPRDSPLD